MFAAVVGNNFRGTDAKVAIKTLEVGDTLTLEREPDNPYDENAVKVYMSVDDEPVWIGYIETTVAAEIAPEMDEGTEYHAVVHSFLSTVKPYVELIA